MKCKSDTGAGVNVMPLTTHLLVNLSKLIEKVSSLMNVMKIDPY